MYLSSLGRKRFAIARPMVTNMIGVSRNASIVPSYMVSAVACNTAKDGGELVGGSEAFQKDVASDHFGDTMQLLASCQPAGVRFCLARRPAQA